MTEIVRKAYGASLTPLADKRQVRVVCSTAEVDRAGEIVVQEGIDTSAYMATGAGTVLWNHNPDKPIAKCIDIGVEGGSLVGLVEFPPAGEDPEADLYYSKVKFGSVSGVSIGFNPLVMEPMDKGNPKKGPQRYSKTELMEFSFTPVQANRGSVVTEKAMTTKSSEPNWKVGASRNLSVDEESSWDGAEAEKSIFDQADFESDSPDTAYARKGFLVYDASAADEKGSYHLPFAKVVDGRLVAVAAGIRNAASRLPQTDVSDAAKEKARAVIDHYEGKMKENAGSAKAVVPIKIKSLYDVSRLACLLWELGWVEESVEWEAAREEDGSQVPAMLGNALRTLGDVLIAMTVEEVNELVSDTDAEEMAAAPVVEIVEASAHPLVKLFVAHNIKAGRKFSGQTISTMKEALISIKDGHQAISDMIDGAEEAGTDTGKAAAAARAKAVRLAEVEGLRHAVL